MVMLNRFPIRVFRDTRGTTAIEYSMIAVCVSVAAIAAMLSVGKETFAVWAKADTAIEEATKKAK